MAANDITPAGVVAAANRILACTLADLARVFGVAPASHTLRRAVSDLLASGYLRQIGDTYAPGRPYDVDQDAAAVPTHRPPDGVSPSGTYIPETHHTRCTHCGHVNVTADWPFTCPQCGAGDDCLIPDQPPAPAPRPTVEFAGPLPDEMGTAGVTDTAGGEYLGSAAVPAERGAAGVALVNYPDGADVLIGTYPRRWEPTGENLTSTVGPQADPMVSPAVARRYADAIDDVVAMGHAGADPYRPSGVQRTAEKIADLLDNDGLSIGGSHGEAELSAAEVRRLLDLVPKPEGDTRRRVVSRPRDGEDGALHVQLAANRAGARLVDLSAVEGASQPPDRDFTVRLSLDAAAQYAARLRQFARAAEAAARQAGTRS